MSTREMIQAEIDYLRARISHLQSQLDSIPIEEPLRKFPTFEIKKHCPRCNIELSGVMGYCCPYPDCPCGLGGVMC